MQIEKLTIEDVLLIRPDVYVDTRGSLYESFNQIVFDKLIKKHVHFTQDVHSISLNRVIRGLHYQLPPYAQAKLIRTIKGEIFDVAVDLRKNSLTFGHWVGQILNEVNRLQIWIPEGFAHGFLVLSDYAEVIYKVTDSYNPQAERCIHWNDKTLQIKWPIINSPIVSKRDAAGLTFKDAEVYL